MWSRGSRRPRRPASACGPLIGSSWGFQATPELTAAAARRAGERAAEVARASARVTGVPIDLAAGAGRGGELGQRLRGAPARRREHLRAGRPARRRHHHHRRRRHPPRAGRPPDLGHGEVVRVQRGQPHRPAHRRVRGRDGRHRDRRRRDATAQLPGRAGPVRHAGLGGRARDRPPGQRSPHRRGGQGAPQRPAVPGADHHPHPRQRADGPPDPRVGGPRHRARSHPRLGGRLRRHLVARPGAARVDALRLRPDEHHRRRHPPGRARQLRLRRRGRAGAGGRHRQGGHVGRGALGSRLRAARRPHLGRHGAGRRRRPPADGADDQRRASSPATARSTR